MSGVAEVGRTGFGWLAIKTPDGNAHVVPEVVFQKIVDGTMRLADLDDWEQIIRAVISDWLKDRRDQ